MNARTLVIMLIGFGLGLSVSSWRSVSADRDIEAPIDPINWQGARLLAEVMDTIKSEYVAEVSDQKLIESAVRGMVSDLDPHSLFLSSERFRDVQISTSGNYAGIGVELNTQDDSIVVVAPIDDSPAARAGVRAGDKIIMVDSIPVNLDRVEDTLAQMRGEVGSQLLLTVTRKDVEGMLNFELTRERINLKSVSGRILEAGIAYVRISQFSETTHKDLNSLLMEMEADGGELSGLILDLRNNPGGVLDAAVQVSDTFLDDGVIVSADGRTAASDFEFSARPGDFLDGAGIAVLVNAGTASASEIVAGALQDHARSVVIGEETFGKGSVQTILPLSDGQAVKLTTSHYFTPSGQSIHGRGITPDVVIQAREVDDIQLQGAVDYLKSGRLQSRSH